MIPFTREELVGVVNKRRPVPMTITDRHFANGRNLGSSTVQLDIKSSPEGLAVAISAGAESQRAATSGWETKTFPIPRFSEHDIVKAADIKNLRMPGTRSQQTPLMQHVNEKLDTLRSRFDRTREYMAVKALQGSIEDGAGNVLVEYNVPGATSVTFNTDGSGDDPLNVFEEQVTAISRELGADAGNVYAYAGVNAYAYLRDQKRINDLLDSQYGVELLRTGRLPDIAGVLVQKMPMVFTDNAGSEVPFVPDDEVIIVSDQMGGQSLFGPCEAPEGLVLQNYYVDTWEQRDPAGTKMRLETNPLPLVRRPNTIRRLKVSQSA